MAGTVVPALLAKVTAALVPSGVGQAVAAVQTAYNGITWLNANVDKLQKVIQGAWAIVQQAASSTAEQVAQQWQTVLSNALPALLDLGARQLGAGGVPDWLADTLRGLDLKQLVRNAIQGLWDTAKTTLSAAVMAGLRQRVLGSDGRPWGVRDLSVPFLAGVDGKPTDGSGMTSSDAWVAIDAFRSTHPPLTALGAYVPKIGDGKNTVAFVDVNGRRYFGMNSDLLDDREKDLGRQVFQLMNSKGLLKGSKWYGQGSGKC